MRIKLLFAFLCFCIINTYSQNTDIYNDILQKLTPQSPQASMMQRFGNYPVDYSTGVPNISVPLYTIKIGDFELPISIAYHASGIRVQDVATPVGLGWALNAGGCITKQVRGNEDKGELSVKSGADLVQKVKSTSGIMAKYWYGIATNQYGDTQTDRYIYNFCGHSGVFRKDANTYSYHTFPYNNMKIEETPQKTFISNKILGGRATSNGYKLTDDNGVEYYFEHVEFSRGDFTYGAPQGYIATAYFLSKIILSNKCDSIIFKYDEGCRYSVQNRQCLVDKGNVGYIDIGSYDMESIKVQKQTLDRSAVHTIETPTTLLKSIEWNENKVDFYYIADRKEFNRWGNVNLDRLVSVFVKNNNGNVIKKVSFYNDNYMEYGLSPYAKRMLLKGMEITGENNENIEKYNFSYNSGALPSYCAHGVGEFDDINCHEDYWGYYNGTNSFGSIPKEYSFGTSEDSNRNPNELFMKSGIIESIEYPTGGKTDFDFEINRLDDGTKWGGLRIKRKTDYDLNGKIIGIKTYKYEMATPSVPLANFKDIFNYTRPYYYHSMVKKAIDVFEDSDRFGVLLHEIVTGEPCVPLSADYGSPIYYYKVTETDEKIKGKIVTEYRYDDARTDDMGMLCYEDMDEFAWMQVQDFSQYGNFDYGNMSVVPTKITKYDSVGNIISEVRNEYEDIFMDTLLLGTRMISEPVCQDIKTGESYRPFIVYGEWDTFSDEKKIKTFNRYLGETYLCSNVWGIPSYKRLVKRTESKDGITKTTSYAYDEQKRTLKPISEQINENQIVTKYTYPYESSDVVAKGMQESNMIVPIKTNVYINGNLSRTDSVAYAQWYNGAYLPTDYYYSLGSGKLEKRCSCTYDKLNRLFSITKDNAASTMFVWLKKYDFPVAKIDGLTPEILKQKINIHLYDVFLSENIGNIDDIVRSNVDSNIYPVTTYKQEPLVGITRIISPTKASTTFKYDSMWRLNSIFDDKNFKISQYEYNYAK